MLDVRVTHLRPGAYGAGEDAARGSGRLRDEIRAKTELRRYLRRARSLKNFTPVSTPEANRVTMFFDFACGEISLRRISRQSRVGTGDSDGKSPQARDR